MHLNGPRFHSEYHGILQCKTKCTVAQKKAKKNPWLRCGVEIHFVQFCEIFTVLTFVLFIITATVNYAKHCQIFTKQLLCHFLLFVEAVWRHVRTTRVFPSFASAHTSTKHLHTVHCHFFSHHFGGNKSRLMSHCGLLKSPVFDGFLALASEFRDRRGKKSSRAATGATLALKLSWDDGSYIIWHYAASWRLRCLTRKLDYSTWAAERVA